MKKIFLICVAIIAIFGCAILVINPTYADILYDEGHLFENLTVVICAIALVLSLALFFKKYKIRSGYGFWLFLSFFLFVFIGDEISWGMWWLGFTKPRIAGVGFDGLHDIFSIGIGAIKLVRNYIRSIGFLDVRSISIFIGSAAGIIALVYFLIKWFVKDRERIYRFFSKNLKWEPFFFLILGIMLLAISIFIDDDNLVSFPHKRIAEESLELLAAISFLFTSLSAFREKRQCTT